MVIWAGVSLRASSNLASSRLGCASAGYAPEAQFYSLMYNT